MGISLVNERELAASIVANLAPKLEAAQARLEAWAEGLLAGNALKLRFELGGRTIDVRLELTPKREGSEESRTFGVRPAAPPAEAGGAAVTSG